MSDKVQWQAPVDIPLDQVDHQPAQEESFAHAREVPVEQAVSVTEEAPKVEREPAARARKSRWRKVFALSAGVVLFAAVVGEVSRLVDWAFSLHLTVGYAAVAVVTTAVFSAGMWLLQGMRGLRQLKAREDVRARAQQMTEGQGEAIQLIKTIEAHYQENTRGAKQEFLAAVHQLDSTYNDKEVVRYLSAHGLAQQDEAAKRCIQRYSVHSGVLVAVSPFATFDMWLVGWRNLRMLRELAEIYGISAGATAQWKLLKGVLHNIAFAGLSEATIHAGTHVLGGSLSGAVSARIGQGIGAGLFTARSGLHAMRLCRPLPDDGHVKLDLSTISAAIQQDLNRKSG